MDIRAKVTVLGEGVRGTLSGQCIKHFDLEGPRPQVFETGVKEIWRVKPEKHMPGRVIHGMVSGRAPERVRRHVALRHEGQPRVVRHDDRARLEEPVQRPARGRAAHEDAPVDARSPRRRRARPVRRQGAPDRRALRAAEALRRRRAPGRRLRGLLQRDEDLGRPPGDEVGHAGGGDDRRRAREGRLHVADARRLHRALSRELGLRGALRRPELPRLVGAGLPVLLPERAVPHVPDRRTRA